jgi:hypothetical protein
MPARHFMVKASQVIGDVRHGGINTGALGQGGRVFGRQAFVGMKGGNGPRCSTEICSTNGLSLAAGAA